MEVEREHGLVLGDHELLGLHQLPVPGGTAREQAGPLEEGIGLRVGVQPVVGGTARPEQVPEEVHRVGVVRLPTRPGDEEVVGLLAGFQERIPVQGADLHIHPQDGLPLLLRPFRNPLVVGVLVEDDLDLGKAPAPGVPRFGQELPRQARVEGVAPGRLEAAEGRDEPRGGQLVPLEHLRHEHPAIQGHREGSPDPGIAEGLPRHAEDVVLDRAAGPPVEVLPPSDLIGTGRIDVALPVELTGLVAVVAHGQIVDGEEGDAPQLHVPGVPVVHVLHNHQAVARFPLLQHERTIAHEVPRLGPSVSELLDGMQREHGPGPAGQQIEDMGTGQDEGDLEGPGIEGANLHILLPAPATEVGISPLEVAGHQFGQQRARPRIQAPEPGVHDRLGHDGCAIGPDRLPEPEGVGAAPVAHLPALREAGFALGRPGVVDDQSLEEGIVGEALPPASDPGRIEGLRLVHHVEAEVLGKPSGGGQPKEKERAGESHGSSCGMGGLAQGPATTRNPRSSEAVAAG